MGDDTGRATSDAPGGARGGAGHRIVDPVEPRVLGIPTRWFRPPGSLDLAWTRHPLSWLAWRREVARLGPYAPDFAAFSAQRGARRGQQGRPGERRQRGR